MSVMSAEDRIAFASGMIALSSLTVLLRFLTRYYFFGRPNGYPRRDLFCDLTIVLALVISIITLVLDIRSKMRSINARGRIGPVESYIPQDMEEAVMYMKEIMYDEYAYIHILWLCKASFLSMYLGIASGVPKNIQRYIHFTTAFTFTSYVALVVILSLWCRPINRTWSLGPDQCIVSATIDFSAITYSLHMTSDILILGVSILVLRSLQIGRREILATLFVICVASLTMIAATIRMYYAAELSSRGATDPRVRTSFPSVIFIISAVEGEIAIIAVCLPAMRVLLKKWMEKSASWASRGRKEPTHLQSFAYGRGSVLGRKSDAAYRLEENSLEDLTKRYPAGARLGNESYAYAVDRR